MTVNRINNIVIIIILIALIFEESNSQIDSSTIHARDETHFIQKIFNPDQPRDSKLNPPIAEEEMKDPCQTAEILEQPWRHWSYDDGEVPLENGMKKYECDAYLLPLRRWFGFSVNGIRSEIIYGHVKSHRCGSIHPLSLSFDNSLLFQQSMLYPQLKSVQNNDHDDELNESEDDDDDDGEDDDDVKKYSSKRSYLKDEDTFGLATTSIQSMLHEHTSKNPFDLTLHQVNESSLYSNGNEAYQNLSLNQSYDITHNFFPNVTILNSSDQNLLTNDTSNVFSSTSSEKYLPQVHSLPKYERIYDSIFESHSRRLYSYMLRDLDIIQELQQFLQLQQILMNSSVIGKELQSDHILLQSINHSIESQFSIENRDHFARTLNKSDLKSNVSFVNSANSDTLEYYALLKELEKKLQKKDELLEKKKQTLSDEREKILKLRKTKLFSKKKNQRVSFLRQNYTVAQLCVYHRFLEESSCAEALSVPIVIKKCPSGAVYWLEKMVLQCPSGACVKKINETVSYEVFLNIPKEELMLKPLSRLIDRDLKSVITIEFNVSTNHVVGFIMDLKNMCFLLRPILAKKLKLTISTKSKSPRKFLKVKGKPIERNYTRTYKEEKFEGAVIPDLDTDAAGPTSQDKRKKKIKRNTKLVEDELSQEIDKLKIGLEEWGGVEALLQRAPSQAPPTTPPHDLLWDNRNSKESEEEYSTEDLALVKFVDYEPVVLEGKMRMSIFVDGNTSLTQTDVLDAVKALNASGELDMENMTFASIYPGFPGDISQLRTGGRAARFWKENKDILSCAFVILGILSAFVVIFYLCRFYKRKKKMQLSYDGERFNKSAQTDPVITGYIFGTSTPIISFSKKRHRESISSEALIN